MRDVYTKIFDTIDPQKKMETGDKYLWLLQFNSRKYLCYNNEKN